MRQKLGLDLSMAHTQTQANAFSNDEMDLLFETGLIVLLCVLVTLPIGTCELNWALSDFFRNGTQEEIAIQSDFQLWLTDYVILFNGGNLTETEEAQRMNSMQVRNPHSITLDILPSP